MKLSSITVKFIILAIKTKWQLVGSNIKFLWISKKLGWDYKQVNEICGFIKGKYKIFIKEKNFYKKKNIGGPYFKLYPSNSSSLNLI